MVSDPADRAGAIAHELADVMTSFDAWATRELEGFNAALTARQLQPIALLTRAEWDQRRAAQP